MEKLKTKDFWDKALARAIRSMCQGALTGMTGCLLIQDVNWLYILSTSGFMFVYSMLTSIVAGIPEAE